MIRSSQPFTTAGPSENPVRAQTRNGINPVSYTHLDVYKRQLKPGDLVMDCGANMGVVTAVLAATGADVIAYEPDPYAFGTLEQKFGDMALSLIHI